MSHLRWQKGDLGNHVEWLDSFVLEENDSVVNVEPRVTAVWDGLLVADRSEDQVRFYSRSGDLRWARSTIDGEPLRKLLSAVAVSPDTVVAIGSDAIAYWWRGLRERGTAVRLNLHEPHEFGLLPGGKLGLATRFSPADPGRLIKILDPSNLQTVGAFFSPPIDSKMVSAAALAGWSGFAVRGDSIATFFSLADSLWVFSSFGERTEVIALAGEHFHTPDGLPRSSSRGDRVAWAARSSMITDLVWLRDGSFLVQYMVFVDNEASYSLLHMSRAGSLVWEVEGSPQMLAWDTESDVGYFRDEGGLGLTRVRLARLRP